MQHATVIIRILKICSGLGEKRQNLAKSQCGEDSDFVSWQNETLPSEPLDWFFSFSLFYQVWNQGYCIPFMFLTEIYKNVFTVCDADDVALTVKTPATVNAAVLTAQMDGTKTFKLTSVTTDPTGAPIAWTPSPDVGNEAATFDISGASLTPATRHTVTLQLEDGVDSTTGTPVSNAGKSVELGVCTCKKFFRNDCLFLFSFGSLPLFTVFQKKTKFELTVYRNEGFVFQCPLLQQQD